MGKTIAQTFYEEGRLEGMQQMLFRAGNIRFGVPADAAVQNAIRAISDFEKLEALSERIMAVNSWNDLLKTP